MTYTLFAGCSYTAGSGFNLEKNEPNLWVNQLHNKFFSNTTQLNVSRGGRSNAGIFQDTVKAMLTYPVKHAIIEWTSMPRYELELGFETYSTRQSFIPNSICRDHNLHDINYTGSYLNSIKDRFTSLAHDCFEILNLLEYVNVIVNLSQLTHTKVFFVNGICPWDNDFFIPKQSVLPSEYTQYTQKILHTETRADDNSEQLYNTMHDGFTKAGGIHQSSWLNLYSSMRENVIDLNDDSTHPGIESNNLYLELFSKELKQHLY